jgi:CRP-like cAMP-binding protein
VNRLTSRSILTSEEEGAILGLDGHLEQVAMHKDFVSQGERVGYSCLVASGLVGRFGQNKDGTRQITCPYIPGDMADLPSVVSSRSGWGLTALAPTTLLQLSHSDLRRLAATYSGIAEAFWRDCVADGSIFSEWIVKLGRRGATARIAHLLCEMAVRYERSGQGELLSFTLPMTQAQLAEATGMTNVHLNRVLRELRLGEIVTVRSGEVIVHDWQQLVALGEFNKAFLMLDEPSPRILVGAL